jgi:hypothetical protein
MRLPFALTVIGALAGCADTLPSGATRIAPEIVFIIPSPAALGGRVVATQLIAAHVQGRSFSFESHVEISPEAIELVGLDPFGRRALTIHWHGGELSYEAAPWFPDRIRPANILADMAVTYWPEASIRAGLASSHATLETAPAQRTILANGHPVIRVEYDGPGAPGWNGAVHYRNEALDYDLEIHSVRNE